MIWTGIVDEDDLELTVGTQGLTQELNQAANRISPPVDRDYDGDASHARSLP